MTASLVETVALALAVAAMDRDPDMRALPMAHKTEIALVALKAEPEEAAAFAREARAAIAAVLADMEQVSEAFIEALYGPSLSHAADVARRRAIADAIAQYRKEKP